ncbi:MAG: hypothetical protein IJD43_15255 [Thermoguttaceae bacterium]|nr:hypothetical protein [Thermoguttaceae bacterium]
MKEKVLKALWNGILLCPTLLFGYYFTGCTWSCFITDCSWRFIAAVWLPMFLGFIFLFRLYFSRRKCTWLAASAAASTLVILTFLACLPLLPVADMLAEKGIWWSHGCLPAAVLCIAAGLASCLLPNSRVTS